jgi:hypothetical protein
MSTDETKREFVVVRGSLKIDFLFDLTSKRGFATMQVHKSLMATNAGYQEQVTTEESA